MIIDGNALIHRSFHALPPTMMTRAGEMTNAVYGFTTVLIKALKELKPDYVALTLDRAAATFRHQEYKEYKATRVKAPDDLYAQIPRVKEIADAFGIPIYEKDGYEADDLIGTIAHKVDGEVEKIILTGDLDTLQLVNPHVKVYTMHKGLMENLIYDDDLVIEKYGLKPEQMVDFKALRGDPSDNIPGVKGIGEKTAVELLKEFKTLEKVYDYINRVESRESKVASQEKIKPRIIELLKQYKDDAFLSKKLVTIDLNAPIKFDLDSAEFGKMDKEKIVKLFSELEFKSLLPRIKDLGIEAAATGAVQAERDDAAPTKHAAIAGFESKFERNKKLFKYVLVDDDKKFDDFFKKLKQQNEFTFDTEVTDFDPMISELLGISFAWHEAKAHYLNLKAQSSKLRSKAQNPTLFDFFTPNNSQASIKSDWLVKLKSIFENRKIKKCGHNMKFDIRVMRHYGIETEGIAFDTMIASYLLNPGSRQHNLDAITFTELGFEKISKDELLGKGKDKINFSQVPTEKLAIYSCEDADFTNRLKLKLGKELKENQLEKLFHDIEMPLVKVLSIMEDNGILIDTGYLEKLGKQVNSGIEKLEEKIWKLAGEKFNISSTKQLKEILFEKLKISTEGIGKTKTGHSTAADELQKMKDSHKIIPLIMEYRELTKLANTYIDSLPQLINPKTGRIHTSFNQAVTATGRLSSTEPNLQNIPIRTGLGREIRKAFVAEKGYKLVSLDYSQIELRLAAHMSSDKKMMDAFKKGLDIHSATAAEINEVPLEKVTQTMRREAKAINFGLIYGQGARGLSQTADIPYERAREFIEHYFKSYKGVKKYIEESIASARDKGYAETLFGRRRYLPEINSSVMQVRKNAERMAINTPLQGTAADMIKAAMVNIGKQMAAIGGQIATNNLSEARMLLQVHDELLFEIKAEMVGKYAAELKEIMENVIKLKVPVVVDVSAGDNWGELEKLELRN